MSTGWFRKIFAALRAPFSTLRKRRYSLILFGKATMSTRREPCVSNIEHMGKLKLSSHLPPQRHVVLPIVADPANVWAASDYNICFKTTLHSLVSSKIPPPSGRQQYMLFGLVLTLARLNWCCHVASMQFKNNIASKLFSSRCPIIFLQRGRTAGSKVNDLPYATRYNTKQKSLLNTSIF